MKVLMIGPSRKVKGGMTTVVDNLLMNGLTKRVTLEYLETINDSNIFSKFIKEICGYQKFKKKIYDFDIIHIHMASNRSTYRKIKYIKLSVNMNERIVLHVDGGGFADFFENETPKKKKYIVKWLNKVDKIIVLSEEWLNYFKKIVNPSKIQIVYNGVTLDKSENNFILNHNILFLGRICKEKGIYNLLDAISILKKEYNDIKLIICGAGEEKKLNDEIRKLGLQNNVILKGWVNGEEKKHCINNCSIFVLPSEFEAMPMSILEVMSYGKIVIATNVGGIPQIIKDKDNGYLIKDNSHTSIAYAIEDLYKNENLRKKIIINSSKTIKEQFDIKSKVNEILKIYSQL